MPIHTTAIQAQLTCASHSRTTTALQNTDPNHSTLRANPFPEVTDLFCRLPLPTLFYQLEAVHLGDLMRLCVRRSVQ